MIFQIILLIILSLLILLAILNSILEAKNEPKRMGRFRPPNVERMKARKNLKGLVKVLRFAMDSSLSDDAARALGEIGGESVIQPLLTEYGSNYYRSSDVIAGALIAMARRMQDTDLTSRLLNKWILELCPEGLAYNNYVGDPDEDFNWNWEKGERRRIDQSRDWDLGAGCRQAAARALGELRDVRAVGPLNQCLKTHHTSSYDDHTRRFAMEALRKIEETHPSALGALPREGRESL